MILFVSGRCDIPAHYHTWFFNRLHAGFVDVRNPYNPHQISRILLNQQNVDALFFCTKNPIHIAKRLDEITLPYCIHVTITPYHRDLEPNLPDKMKVIEAFKTISRQIGPSKIMLRYDPILINDTYDVSYHHRAFEKLTSQLEGYTDTCIISFVDMYKNVLNNMNVLKLHDMDESIIHNLCEGLSISAQKHHMKLQTCAEDYDLSQFNISKEPCVSSALIQRLTGLNISYKRQQGVRSNCACLPTVDIGDYNACAHGCRYCYANYAQDEVQDNMKKHNPNSSVLIGEITNEDHITIREDYKDIQLKLL